MLVIVLVHRYHNWVGLLNASLPLAACIVLCDTMSSLRPNERGFQVTSSCNLLSPVSYLYGVSAIVIHLQHF